MASDAKHGGWQWPTGALLAGVAIGLITAQLSARDSVASAPPARVATGYNDDDPARLQPTMRAFAVSMLAVQSHFARGFSRPAEPHARAMVDAWSAWRERTRGDKRDEHAFGARFEVIAGALDQRLRALHDATQRDSIGPARQAYGAVLSQCLTCHHDGARGAHVVFGRLGEAP